MRKKKLLGLIAVGIASAGMVFGGALAAQAETGASNYCVVSVSKPVLSSTKVKNTGSSTSCSGTAQTLYVQIHRSEGIINPLVAQKKAYGELTDYPTQTVTGCDGGGAHAYFGQAWMRYGTTGSNGSIVYTTNGATINPCD